MCATPSPAASWGAAMARSSMWRRSPGVASSSLQAPYGAAKAGLISLTKSLAVAWGADGILVNALCPGWTARALNRTLGEDPAAGPATVATVTLRRWGTAEEMARAAVFLASDAASS